MNLAVAFPDIVIGAAYYALPIAMAVMAWRHRSVWARRVLMLYAAFIVSCGTGHMVDAWYISMGECAAGTVVKVGVNYSTAMLSVLTACAIIPSLPTYIAALRMPFSLDEIRKLMDELDRNR